jgi:hypothetical protein
MRLRRSSATSSGCGGVFISGVLPWVGRAAIFEEALDRVQLRRARCLELVDIGYVVEPNRVDDQRVTVLSPQAASIRANKNTRRYSPSAQNPELRAPRWLRARRQSRRAEVWHGGMTRRQRMQFTGIWPFRGQPRLHRRHHSAQSGLTAWNIHRGFESIQSPHVALSRVARVKTRTGLKDRQVQRAAYPDPVGIHFPAIDA